MYTMPYAIKKLSKGVEVINKDTGRVTAKHTTLEKAKRQIKLLQGIHYGTLGMLKKDGK